jgi:L-alanine-DL-glutamate epimerase-like enolase superfamily enzyme
MSNGEALLVETAAQTWPLANPFVISRGAKTTAHVVVVKINDGTHTGRGEAVPYSRYGETIDDALKTIRAIEHLITRSRLAGLLPPGAARNAIDCALWDLDAKRTQKRVWQLAGLSEPQQVLTAYTVSLGEPAEMAIAASNAPHFKLLKLKLGGAGDPARIAAVRAARPDARLIADANESWTPDMLEPFLDAAAAAGVELIEQPLPAGADQPLCGTSHAVPICADESAHTSADLAALKQRYDAVNIKLDKTGGLTEALVMARAARTHGFKIMIGSMVATSLAVAPAVLLAQGADWVDIDGPLLLARDREPCLSIHNGWVAPPTPDLWG